jgi:hypothetical protein
MGGVSADHASSRQRRQVSKSWQKYNAWRKLDVRYRASTLELISRFVRKPALLVEIPIIFSRPTRAITAATQVCMTNVRLAG